ncbi:MAG TPA: hypothetical protein DD706_18515 [Nitrospiraceae bacterium]|nr:hypothetical protein [Nitrospiraceae bacterium]
MVKFTFFNFISHSKMIPAATLLLLLLGLPPLGMILSGHALPPHLTLLPIPTQPGPASLSWPIFAILSILLFGTLGIFLWRYANTRFQGASHPPSRRQFPWWGWMAGGWMGCAWIIAWAHFSWFQGLQPHTFPLLWCGYIVLINAFTFFRTGRCLLVNQPKFFMKLFVLSAGFWWVFEYLNQFVNNWHYLGMTVTHPASATVWMTIAFSTVLPAVLGTYEYLASFTQAKAPFEDWFRIPTVSAPSTGWLLCSLGGFGLLMIGLWPTLLFSLLWIAPLLIMLGIQNIRGNPTILTPLAEGNWVSVVLAAQAALICGALWEMWNVYSLVHWEYSIPYVHAFRIGEMPVLGYAGYVPFGLECLAVTELFYGTLPWNQASPESSHRGIG